MLRQREGCPLSLPLRAGFIVLGHVLLCPESLTIVSTKDKVQSVVRLPRLFDRTSPPWAQVQSVKFHRGPKVRRAGPLVSLNSN